MNQETRKFLQEISKIANDASLKAQEENRRLGVPNVYSINGRLFYEFNGKLSITPPNGWKDRSPARRNLSRRITKDERAITK